MSLKWSNGSYIYKFLLYKFRLNVCGTNNKSSFNINHVNYKRPRGTFQIGISVVLLLFKEAQQ